MQVQMYKARIPGQSWPAVEKCAAGAVLRGKISGGVQGASAERDFKDAEQVQRDERDERGEADDENGAAELHAPAGLMSGGFHADDDGGEHEKRAQHADRVNSAERSRAARRTAGLVDEAEDFERDDRQHARHQIQNQPADEGVEQHLPEGLGWDFWSCSQSYFCSWRN